MLDAMVNRLREAVGEAFIDGKETIEVKTDELCALLLSVKNGAVAVAAEPKRRGRKPGTVITKPTAVDKPSTGRRGRPKGSKNKTKEGDVAESVAGNDSETLDPAVAAEIEAATAEATN